MDPNITVSKATDVISENMPSMSLSPSSGTPEISSLASFEPSSGTNWGKISLYASIILILAILGFNLFRYLGNITDTLSQVFGPLASLLGRGVTSSVKQTIDVSAEGTKGIVDTSTKIIDTGLNALEGRLNGNIPRNKIDDPTQDKTQNSNGKAINTSNQGGNGSTTGPSSGNNNKSKNNTQPEPDDAGSKTQGKPGKSGYCYIGEDRGFRSCIRVDQDDTCMSGEIFPTKDLCVNPNLRE